MLHTRKIGQYYYVRGTVRVGKQTIKVKEHSTGFVKSKDAASYVSKLEDEIRQSVLNPNADRTSKTLFDDCLMAYLNSRELKKPQIQHIMSFSEFFEGTPVSDIQKRWAEFREKKRGIKQNTFNRYASSINAILSFAKDELKISPELIKRTPVNDAVVFLMPDVARDKILNCYSEKIRPIFTLLYYQGFREQECLQLQWEDIRLKDATIIIRTSKNGETRTVPMHKKVWWVLARKWIKEKCPVSGSVFKTMYKNPYRDGRKLGGGGTLYVQHKRALRLMKERYGISLNMRVHDFRHDWAARMVMAGVDLLTVQRLGGWKSMQMVSRYATFSAKHESDAINKI